MKTYHGSPASCITSRDYVIMQPVKLFLLLITMVWAAWQPECAKALADESVIAVADSQDNRLLSNTPLLTIRFYQQEVRYEQLLYKAVKKAYDIKPEVQFDVVSIIPTTGGNSKATSEANAKMVVANMAQIGIPESQISLRYKENPAVSANEVHIFVK